MTKLDQFVVELMILVNKVLNMNQKQSMEQIDGKFLMD
jgi:hypothetical protein